jgi:hypothetical protein
MLIHLPSAASYLDTHSFTTYAAYQQGGYDPDSAIPLSNCSRSWWAALSARDHSIVRRILRSQKQTSRIWIKHFTLRRLIYNLAVWKTYKNKK